MALLTALALMLCWAAGRPASAELLGQTVDGRAELVAGGTQVVVRGWVRATEGDDVHIHVFLTQARGRRVTEAAGFMPARPATGEPQRWEVVVHAEPGETFKPGQAMASVEVFSSNDDDGTSDEFSLDVRVRLGH